MALQNRLLMTLDEVRAAGRVAVCGYFLIGYPTPEAFFRLVRAARELDVIEFGIPSEHPSYDGPIIAAAHQVVVGERGLGAETALALVGGLNDIRQPHFVMTYADVGRHLSGFLRLCIDHRIYGMLAPDLAPEERGYVKMLAQAMHLALITLYDVQQDEVALREAVEMGDVIYLKLAPGRTGKRLDFDAATLGKLNELVARIRSLKPTCKIAVGIGIQQPEQVAALAATDVDMVVIGTTMVEHTAAGEESLVAYVRALRKASVRAKSN